MGALGTPRTPSSPAEAARLIAGWLADEADRGAADLTIERHLRAAREEAAGDAVRDARRACERAACDVLGAIGSPRPEADAAVLLGAVDGLRLQALGGQFDRERVSEQLERLLAALAGLPS